MVIPDVLEKHRPRNDLARMLHEVLQQPELPWLEDDLLAGARDAVRQPVHFKVCYTVDGRLRRSRRAPPPRENFNARQKFGEGVGLRDVVVTAGPETPHAVVDLTECRKDEHRGVDVLLAKGAHEREAVELRQHAVDDEDIVLAALRHGIAVEAVGRVVGDMPCLAERLDEVGGRLTVVLDDQNTHEETYTASRPLTAGRREAGLPQVGPPRASRGRQIAAGANPKNDDALFCLTSRSRRDEIAVMFSRRPGGGPSPARSVPPA